MALSAFKIACLTYMPSQVLYEHSIYARRTLIDIKGQLIDLCYEQLYQPDIKKLDDTLKNILYKQLGT